MTAHSTPHYWRLKCVPCTDEKCICCWMMKLCCRDFTPSTLTQNYTGTAYSPFWQRQIKTWHSRTCCSNMWQQTMRLPTYCHNGSEMSFVGQEPPQNGEAGCKAVEEQKTRYWTEVCVCEAPYPGSMLSKSGKVQQLNRTKLKSVPNKACSQIRINW